MFSVLTVNRQENVDEKFAEEAGLTDGTFRAVAFMGDAGATETQGQQKSQRHICYSSNRCIKKL